MLKSEQTRLEILAILVLNTTKLLSNMFSKAKNPRKVEISCCARKFGLLAADEIASVRPNEVLLGISSLGTLHKIRGHILYGSKSVSKHMHEHV
jgi:hypothetical protein